LNRICLALKLNLEFNLWKAVCGHIIHRFRSLGVAVNYLVVHRQVRRCIFRRLFKVFHCCTHVHVSLFVRSSILLLDWLDLSMRCNGWKFERIVTLILESPEKTTSRKESRVTSVVRTRLLVFIPRFLTWFS
jgi:hypothetical protein